MTITNALASLPVRDLATARGWYESLLGSGSQPMPEVIEWQLPSGGGLQVYAGAERAGGGTCTLIVDDIDAVAELLHTSGLTPDATVARDERVDTIMVTDPDGNSIAFAMPKDERLAR